MRRGHLARRRHGGQRQAWAGPPASTPLGTGPRRPHRAGELRARGPLGRALHGRSHTRVSAPCGEPLCFLEKDFLSEKGQGHQAARSERHTSRDHLGSDPRGPRCSPHGASASETGRTESACQRPPGGPAAAGACSASAQTHAVLSPSAPWCPPPRVAARGRPAGLSVG